MTSQEFIDKILEIYSPIEYSKIEFNEINDLLYDLSSEQRDILYGHIRNEYPSHYKKPPGYGFIKKSCQTLRLIKSKQSEKLSDEIYKKTPQYALDQGRDMNIKAIIDHVKFLRKKQQQLWDAGKTTLDMSTEDQSSIAVWGEMPNINQAYLDIAKERILNGNNRLYDLMTFIKVSGIDNKVKKIFKDEEIPF